MRSHRSQPGPRLRPRSKTEMKVTTPGRSPSRRPPREREEAPAKTLEARQVNLFYGDFHAVEDVTLTIEPNKVTALIGSSGCGKTTLLRSLNRMHELTPGAAGGGRDHPRRP